MSDAFSVSPDELKLVSEASQTYITWALSLIGGSVALIIGTSHQSPQSAYGRFPYLLFPVAWALLGLSMRYGDELQRNYLAFVIGSSSNRGSIFNKIL